ncbi:SGNH/GDSL hydrolase family protein [Gordonia malaquae]|uniref:SGNH/GDSL hydrolase family protein n=1 Tax=Gordonia malaquae TaxID=410332 RepID=UPI0030FEE359
MSDRRFGPGVAAAAVLTTLAVIVGGVVWMNSRGGPDDTSRAAEPPARVIQHVNIGDSFAAGTGILPLQPDSQFTCQRSSSDFATVLAARRGHHLVDVACAGARTEHLYRAQYEGAGPQLDAVTPNTDLVTLMIGGNDASLYSSLIRDCADVADTDPSGAPCRTELGSGPADSIREEIAPAVEKGLRDIAARAPHARVVIVGYPWLVPPSTSCRPAVQIADGDIAYVRRVQSRLNAAIARAASAAGATFVDMSVRSRGHDACAAKGIRWIEPMVGGSSPIVMHPNAAGQRAIADAVESALG